MAVCSIAAAATALLMMVSDCAGLMIQAANAASAIIPFQVLRSCRRFDMYFMMRTPVLFFKPIITRNTGQ